MTLGDHMREIARDVMGSFIKRENALFKVGDVVRCIEPCDQDWANMEEGKVYTVVGLTQVLGPGVYLEGFSNWVYEHRFVLDESPAQDSYLELFI